MSLLGDLAARAGEQVDDHADEWLARGLESARAEVERRRGELRDQVFDPAFDGAPDPERKRVEVEAQLLAHTGDALDVLEEHQGALAHLGRARFAALVVQLGAGREDEARRLYLASGASFAERRAASATSTETTLADTAAREQAWREVLAGAREIGLLALKAAIPFLLAAL